MYSLNCSLFPKDRIILARAVTFQAVDQIIILACAMHHDILCLLCKLLIVPEWEILLQYLQVCGLLQPLEFGVEDCVIFAVTSMSFREMGLL